jgi:hypothetical protein
MRVLIKIKTNPAKSNKAPKSLLLLWLGTTRMYCFEESKDQAKRSTGNKSIKGVKSTKADAVRTHPNTTRNFFMANCRNKSVKESYPSLALEVKCLNRERNKMGQ